MCGIAGIIRLDRGPVEELPRQLNAMNRLQKHRGPDGEGIWTHPEEFVGFGHVRLSIIDIAGGAQPMGDEAGNRISFNGEIYNFIELRDELGREKFRTGSDTEVILAAYRRWGPECLCRLRGMFAFALWDEKEQTLFCARDRFGIKPFYYQSESDVFRFASEAKALLPFLPSIETDLDGLKDYLAFHLCLDGKTLFRGIRELPPGHRLILRNGHFRIERYWDVEYQADFYHTARYFHEHLRELLEESVRLHLRGDVPVGAYVSGGIDSSCIAALASRNQSESPLQGFHGKFDQGSLYDESHHARTVAAMHGMALHELAMSCQDFTDQIRKVIYHLDYPVAGPGSFPQYMVSRLAADRVKVVLGGQGGDEIFGGYARYLIAYFERCILGAIDGTLNSGEFIVTYDSIIPNLKALQNYKPLLRHFWSEGLFDEPDLRYFRLINRATDLKDEIRWELLEGYSALDTFRTIFHSPNVASNSYFDRITHFDFKTLLPGLLQVEDRMSMAHGLESRVPLLDHPLVQFAATMPSNIKFKDGTLKRALVSSIRDLLPDSILERKDKMGFPVPFDDWIQNGLRQFIEDTFRNERSQQREVLDAGAVLRNIGKTRKFSRKLWGLLSLELWHQEFHDKPERFQIDRLTNR